MINVRIRLKLVFILVMLDFFHLFVKLFKVSGFTLPVNLKSRNSGQHLFYADVAKHDLRKIENFTTLFILLLKYSTGH